MRLEITRNLYEYLVTGLHIIGSGIIFILMVVIIVDVFGRAFFGHHLDVVLHQLQGEALGQSDPAELAAGVGVVLVAPAQAGLRIDLNDVHEVVPAEAVLDLHDLGGNLAAEIISPVIHPGDELEALQVQFLEAPRLENPGIADQQIEPAVA